jgi:hypothetical protein
VFVDHLQTSSDSAAKEALKQSTRPLQGRKTEEIERNSWMKVCDHYGLFTKLICQ